MTSTISGAVMPQQETASSNIDSTVCKYAYACSVPGASNITYNHAADCTDTSPNPCTLKQGLKGQIAAPIEGPKKWCTHDSRLAMVTCNSEGESDGRHSRLED